MEYPLNIYITAHTLISSLGFGTEENLKAIRTDRSGVHLQEAGPDAEGNRISDTPIQAGLIDSAELEKRARQAQIEAYPRLEQLFILTIQEILSQSGADLCKQDSVCSVVCGTSGIGIHSNSTKKATANVLRSNAITAFKPPKAKNAVAKTGVSIETSELEKERSPLVF